LSPQVPIIQVSPLHLNLALEIKLAPRQVPLNLHEVAFLKKGIVVK
jgi:hypothetical protein